MSDPHGTHNDLHSEQGALAGEHPGRATNPVIKVHDLAWLEFRKPDLARAETFAHAFGFATVLRTSSELHLRGSNPGSPCVIIRQGPRSRFLAVAFRAAEEADLVRLAGQAGVVEDAADGGGRGGDVSGQSVSGLGQVPGDGDRSGVEAVLGQV